VDLKSKENVMTYNRGRGFTLVELLVVIAIIGVLVALLLPAVQAAREAARRSQCSNHLKQIGLACHNYASANRIMPVSNGADYEGRNGAGWILAVLPFLEEQSLYDQFSPYFNGVMQSTGGILDPRCREALRTPRPGLRCPSDATFEPTSKTQFQVGPHECAVTSYKGIAGTKGSCVWAADCDGLLWHTTYRRPVKFAKISDGTSHTLMIGEDLPSQNNHSAAYYANGDYCSAVPFSLEPAPAIFNIIYNPPQPDNWVTVMTFRSTHPGGSHFCLADGSVHFLVETIDEPLFRALCTRAGGELANVP
jgi:prepilin-type N-terminal cleavage/methylation domain-containing protein